MGEYIIYAHGHKNIKATHTTTWQITRENDLTPEGDCIIGVKATSSTQSIPQEFKTWIRSGGKVYYSIAIMGSEYIANGEAWGHIELSLDHETEIVVRKSDFSSPRTLAVHSNFVAKNIPREWIPLLQKSETQIEIKFFYSDSFKDQ